MGPSGWATPSELRLRLTRTDRAADAFAHIHEVHHLSLNDSTAWGSLLHVVAEAPGTFDVDLGLLVDECRTTHEAYATYAAMSIVESMMGPQPGVLTSRPQYESWWRLFANSVALAGGPQRRYLLATALARACMQCPVAEAVISSGPFRFAPSLLRQIDRPDGRLRRLLTGGGDVFGTAASVADTAVPAAADVDARAVSPLTASADHHDELWTRWEESAYDVLANALADDGASVLAYNGHQDTTNAMIDAVAAISGPLSLRGQSRFDPVQSDLGSVSSLLVKTHEDLVVPRYRARVLNVAVADIAQVVDEYSRIDGIPSLQIVSRLPERLAAAYQWEEANGFPADNAVAGIRLVEGDSETSVIVWIPVPFDTLDEVLADWGDRGPVVSVAAASCLVDPEFHESVLKRLTSLMPVTILVDVPPDRLIKSWTRDGATIDYSIVRIDDSAGEWWAVVFTAVDDSLLWFVVGTEATVGLYRQGLGSNAVDRLELGDRWLGPLQSALTATLAFETTLDFGGVEART